MIDFVSSRLSLMPALLCFILLAIRANAATDGFEQGNHLYEAGKYSESAAAYEDQVRHGAYSANLFFNLANAYYRLGDRGRAILNYQRALLLEPDHAEAAANLAFTRGGRSPTSADNAGLRATVGILNADTWSWLAAAAGWLGAVGLLAAIFARGRRVAGFGLAAAAFALCVLCAGAAWFLAEGAKNTARAVVLEDKTSARYAPADTAPSVTELSAGSEVRVLAERGAWTYAQLATGARGWLPVAKIERLIPAARSDKP